MESKNTILLFTLLILMTGNLLHAQDWVDLQNDSLHFKISSPEALIPNEKDALTELGVLKVNSFGFLPKKGNNLIFQVIVINYPTGSLPIDSTELHMELLSDLITQSADPEDSQLIYQKEIFYHGHTGIQWRIHSGKEISIKSNAFIANHKIYITQVMSKQDKSLNQDIDKFLKSFRIVD